MSTIPVALRHVVIERAEGRCEYCGLSQDGQAATFHLDHVTPVAVGGPTVAENLAFACVSCSLRKAARQTARDPESGQEVTLYHPRQEVWSAHFQWDGVRLVGLTATGRATIELLKLNRALILSIRTEEAVLGRHPPPMRWSQRRDTE